MRLRGKINVKTLAGCIAFGIILLISMNLNAFNTPPKFFFNSLTAFSDTIPTIDTTQQLGDTVVVRGKNNSSRNSKDSSGIAKT
ncbi:hypothetical protein, partial [Hydrotalea sp.]|uniref:hypothetical protein n=1 Tax=Hydrotalea sp. TaxID=2881279 RepID=UPI002604995F